MKAYAEFSDCKRYRYGLWRIWDEHLPHVAFIGLNPSDVDEVKNNPTINRCISFARSWGYGGVCVANLFAFNTAVPEEMKKAKDPVGPANDKWLLGIAKSAAAVVAAWGNDGAFLDRSAEVKNMISDLHALKINKSGEPAHPLYLRGDLVPMPLSSFSERTHAERL